METKTYPFLYKIMSIHFVKMILEFGFSQRRFGEYMFIGWWELKVMNREHNLYMDITTSG